VTIADSDRVRDNVVPCLARSDVDARRTPVSVGAVGGAATWPDDAVAPRLTDAA